MRAREDSCAPSRSCGRGASTEGFDLGTGGGVFVLVLTRGGAWSSGSGGSVKVRRGLGDLIGGGGLLTPTAGAVGCCVGVAGRRCSNMLTREPVGGIGVSSVGLSRGAALVARAADREAALSWVGRGDFCCGPGFWCSSLASTFPTLPDGGSTSRSSASLSLAIMLGVLGGAAGLSGLMRAAASLAAVYDADADADADGEGARSLWVSGTLKELELLTCLGEGCGLLALRELPPV